MIKNLIFGLVLLTATCNKENNTLCSENCGKVPETGPCKAAFKRYYFDKTEKKCKEFTWGGCNGVVPFETLEECQACGCK